MVLTLMVEFILVTRWWSLSENGKTRVTKKQISTLRLASKSSFTLSKLRFFGLRKPKNSSFYPTSLQTWVTQK